MWVHKHDAADVEVVVRDLPRFVQEVVNLTAPEQRDITAARHGFLVHVDFRVHSKVDRTNDSRSKKCGQHAAYKPIGIEGSHRGIQDRAERTM
jgi:hypothetical protein